MSMSSFLNIEYIVRGAINVFSAVVSCRNSLPIEVLYFEFFVVVQMFAVQNSLLRIQKPITITITRREGEWSEVWLGLVDGRGKICQQTDEVNRETYHLNAAHDEHKKYLCLKQSYFFY